jgi:MIP family channel proteins
MPTKAPVRTNGVVTLTLRSPAVSVKAELGSHTTRRALFGEFLGTLLFVLFGAGVVVVTAGLLGEKLTSARLLTMALAQGIAFPLFMLAMMRISGGHLNPAVTFAAVVSREMTITRAAIYVVAQCAGAVGGAYLLTVMVPGAMQAGLGAHGVAAKVTVTGALLTEIVSTFVLVSAVLATTRGALKPASLGFLTIGVSATVASLFGTALTGASMNPARSFGPALMAGAWNHQWLFWIGPLVGALIAGLVYQFCFAADRDNRGDYS